MNTIIKKYNNVEGVLRRNGFCVEKSSIDDITLSNIKNDLMVTPVVHRDFQKNVKAFPVFFENEKNIYLPPYWAKEHIGEPTKNYIKSGLPFTSELKTTFEPRDYQLPIVKHCYKTLKKIGGGILTIGCGKGKTYMSIKLASMLKQKTLVIVHTGVLMDQWIENILAFIPEAKVGTIKGKVFDIEDKDFVVAMLQTVCNPRRNYTWKTFKDFGTTIIDENHHISAPSFSKCLPIISSKYKIGLSATPERNDKLEKIFYWYLGPSMWYDRSSNKSLIPLIKIVNFNDSTYEDKVNWRGSPDLHKMTEQILENEKRNAFIVHQTMNLVSMGRQLLVLSSRRGHLKNLKELFDIHCEGKFTTGFYVGGMKKKELEVSSLCNVLFGTYQLVSEGFDLPTLNTLIMCSPKKEVEQIVGRILRAKTTHEPFVIDIIDSFNVYQNQGRHRDRYYKKSEFKRNFIMYNSKSKIPTINDKYDFRLNKAKKSSKDKMPKISILDFID